jgi:hypothetical protein
MALKVEHDLHRRRFSRNLGVGLALGTFVLLVFGLSVVKIRATGPIQGYDHVAQPELAAPAK